MIHSRVFFLLSLVFFILFLGLSYEHNSPKHFVFAAIDTKDSSSYPTGIVIPSAHIWLPVFLTNVENHTWKTSNSGVSFLSNGIKPGDHGNAVFYGHNWPNLLGNLKLVTPGDTIQIISNTGVIQDFTVSTVQQVSPLDISVLKQTEDKRITVYTCIGFLDSRRLVVVAVLKKLV